MFTGGITLDALINFIEHRMQEDNIKPADVARRGKINPAQLSRFLNRESKAGIIFCRRIAKAFNEPAEKIYRLAGLLPSSRDDDLLQDLVEVAQYLDNGHLHEVIDYAQHRWDRQVKEEEEKERQKKRLAVAIENATETERLNAMIWLSEEYRRQVGLNGDVPNIEKPALLADQPDQPPSNQDDEPKQFQ